MAPTNGEARYVIDPAASQFAVQAFASGLGAAVSHSPKIAIRSWTGEIQMAANGHGKSSLQVRVKAGALEVLDEMRESDRREIHRVMRNEVLETDQFPEMVYESEEVKIEPQKENLYRVFLGGMLRLHGISNRHEFASQVALGLDTLRAYGNFTVRQTDYDIRIASIAGGTLRLQDELKFSFYVVARKQQ
jgi:polyisoprenoid-binding protein YceI